MNQSLDQLVEINLIKPLTRAEVLAIITQESSGEYLFNPEDLQLKFNLYHAYISTGIPVKIIQGLMTSGNDIAKFRFSAASWEWARKISDYDATDRLLLSCSYGYGQQLMRWYLLAQGIGPANYVRAVKAFMFDPSLQVKTLVKTLLSVYNDDKALMFSKYNLNSTKVITAYGKSVLKLYEELIK